MTVIHPAFSPLLYLTGVQFLWRLIREYSSPCDIEESNSTEVVKSKLKEKFLAPVLCLDKYQRRIQKPVHFNSFKPLTISARSYFLVA